MAEKQIQDQVGVPMKDFSLGFLVPGLVGDEGFGLLGHEQTWRTLHRHLQVLHRLLRDGL